MTPSRRIPLLVVFLFVLTVLSASAFENGVTERVSVASDGTQTDLYSEGPTISADGRYVAFSSEANNLVAGVSGLNVFVYDRQTAETSLASVAPDGTPGNSGSTSADISADGRYVVFDSWASNLVPGVDGLQAYVHDRQTGETAVVSVASDGTPANDLSGWPAISADGRYVAFASYAGNLVPGDTNSHHGRSSASDVFVHDQQTGETTRVSVASDGSQGNRDARLPAISGDGRYVAFRSGANNLVPGDTNDEGDVFVHDQQTGETTRVSVASDGTQANGGSIWAAISADGRYVAFSSDANNLIVDDTNGVRDVFVHDRQTGETTRVSTASDGTQRDGGSATSSISADGRYVAFDSFASIQDERDVFIHDRQTGQTELVSVNVYGSSGNRSSGGNDITADGQCVVFSSDASDLIVGDTNDVRDIFVRCQTTIATHVNNFTANSNETDVVLAWQTTQEVNLVGFDLYRAVADSDFERITDTPIPAQGNAEAGAAYEYVDHAGSGHHIYQLVSVEAGGEEVLRAQAEAEIGERHLFVPMLQR